MSDPTPRRLARLPAVLHQLGDISPSSFHRHYRWLYRKDPAAPQPVATPDGTLAYWADAWPVYLEACGNRQVEA